VVRCGKWPGSVRAGPGCALFLNIVALWIFAHARWPAIDRPVDSVIGRTDQCEWHGKTHDACMVRYVDLKPK
jgi:hypothetical protein